MIGVKSEMEAAEGRWRKIRLAIVRHSLFAERAPAPPDWVDAQIQSLNDDELTIIWLRNAIAEGRWRDILSGVSWLSKQNQSTDRWRYWVARSRDELGLAGGDSLWASLAQSRSFHGFLAADRVGSAYTLNEISPQGELPPWASRPDWECSARRSFWRWGIAGSEGAVATYAESIAP